MGSRRLFGGTPAAPASLYGTAGLELDLGGSPTSAGLRPFFGINVALISRVAFFSAEVRPAQPWEQAMPYSIRLTARVYRNMLLSGGVQSTGYRTLPFWGVSLPF